MLAKLVFLYRRPYTGRVPSTFPPSVRTLSSLVPSPGRFRPGDTAPIGESLFHPNNVRRYVCVILAIPPLVLPLSPVSVKRIRDRGEGLVMSICDSDRWGSHDRSCMLALAHRAARVSCSLRRNAPIHGFNNPPFISSPPPHPGMLAPLSTS